jgi:hypothetical protein
MKAEFNDPDKTNFNVDVRLRARSEDQIDDSILGSDEDLEDSGYLRLGLLLRYSHIRGIPTIHVGSSIHIQYPNIPEEVVGANKTVETLEGPERKQRRSSCN